MYYVHRCAGENCLPSVNHDIDIYSKQCERPMPNTGKKKEKKKSTQKRFVEEARWLRSKEKIKDVNRLGGPIMI